jgi:DNA-binding response OmpR family regulator
MDLEARALHGGVKILFVEDRRSSGQALAGTAIAQFLGRHDVTHAGSLAEAEVHLGRKFDAALVDYDLPDGKGTEIVRALRGRGFTGVIVAVSAHDDGNAALRAAGARTTCAKKDFAALPLLLACVTTAPPHSSRTI